MNKQMISNWVGNEGYSKIREDFMIDILLDIARGAYTPEDLVSDISEYAEE